MRDNGIKEAPPRHRGPFIQQWHQKLHSNTTVDDIYICEACLRFLPQGREDSGPTCSTAGSKGRPGGDEGGLENGGIHGPAEHLSHMSTR